MALGWKAWMSESPLAAQQVGPRAQPMLARALNEWRRQMNEVTIHLYCRLTSGKIEDAQHTFDLSDFGGFLPAVGDKILDPGVPASLERNVPENRRLWTVVDRVFNPRDTKDSVALVIESCPVSDHEAVLLPSG
jgi:hypothetical protein